MPWPYNICLKLNPLLEDWTRLTWWNKFKATLKCKHNIINLITEESLPGHLFAQWNRAESKCIFGSKTMLHPAQSAVHESRLNIYPQHFVHNHDKLKQAANMRVNKLHPLCSDRTHNRPISSTPLSHRLLLVTLSCPGVIFRKRGGQGSAPHCTEQVLDWSHTGIFFSKSWGGRARTDRLSIFTCLCFSEGGH